MDEDWGATHENARLEFDRYLIKDGKTFILDLDYHNDVCIPDEPPIPGEAAPDTGVDYGWTAPIEFVEECDEEEFEGTKEGESDLPTH